MHAPAIPRVPLSPRRIGAMSVALGVHAIAFGILLLPPAALLRPAEVPLRESILAEILPQRVRPEPVPAPPIPPPPRRAPPTPAPRTLTPVLPVAPVVPFESEFVIQAAAADPGPVEETMQGGGGGPVTLAYRSAPPPPYPSIAIRRGLEGEVLLLVEVDAAGIPRSVEIARSSGHSVLDRAARDQVLARWRFHPAMSNGVPVTAIAEVPVLFRITRG